jgi:UDP-N-acetylmuramyl pentapeptide phosphotransferase/UDP-N-acetylglucosamine-1-phosphate transferase
MNTNLQGHRSLADAGALLLPTLAVVLFHLLRMRLQTPTAGGLAFLAAALVAFYFFPRRRIRAGRLLVASLLAAGAAVLLGLLL